MRKKGKVSEEKREKNLAARGDQPRRAIFIKEDMGREIRD